MRRMLLVIPLLLAGCSTGSTAGRAAASSPAVRTLSLSSSAQAPTSAAAAPELPKLGATQAFNDNGTNSRLTVFAYRQPTAATATRPQAPNTEWASADVQVCLDALSADFDYAYVNRTPWSLVYADGTVANPSPVTYQQFDAPVYPVADRTLKPGRCVRGWVTFTAPAGQRATMVEYQSEVGRADVFDWAVS